MQNTLLPLIDARRRLYLDLLSEKDARPVFDAELI